jgi:hypothetical protein
MRSSGTAKNNPAGDHRRGRSSFGRVPARQWKFFVFM